MTKTILKQLPAPAPGKLRVVLDMDKTMIIARKVDIRSEKALGTMESRGAGLSVAPNASLVGGDPLKMPDVLVSNQEIREMGWPLACDERQIWFRPGLQEFLERVSKFAEIIVWTLSEYRLAHRIITKLDKYKRISGMVGREVNGSSQTFRGVWFEEKSPSPSTSSRVFSWTKRDSTLDRPGTPIDLSHHLTRRLPAAITSTAEQHVTLEWIKDLSILNSPLARTVIIDDWAELCIFNPLNAIVVDEFRHPEAQQDDQELTRIHDILRKLRHSTVDVRRHINDTRMGHLFEERHLRMLVAHKEYCLSHRSWVGRYSHELPVEEEVSSAKSPTSLVKSFSALTSDQPSTTTTTSLTLSVERLSIRSPAVPVMA